jgi:TPR repeat protein
MRIPARQIAAAAAILLATSALAGVKEGVDAWQAGNFGAAVKEWRPLADQGDSDAQFNLGQAYKLGRGVPADLRIAQSWYEKAAQQGHAPARCRGSAKPPRPATRARSTCSAPPSSTATSRAPARTGRALMR